mgnify:CR=1 FL=1
MKKDSFLSRLKSSIPAYLFLLPLFLGITIFSYYAAFSGIFHSFFEWSNDGSTKFVGLQNYINLFQDPIFLHSIPAMLKLMLPKLAISIVVPLIMAELIFYVSSKKMQYWYRIICLLPMVAPSVVGTLVWKYIYDPASGLAVTLARVIGLVPSTANIDFLGDPALAIPSIIFMGFPWIGGTAVLIYMSGLMSISGEVREASLLDGCSTIRRIISIDLPLIMGQIRYFLIFGIISCLQDYSVQIILTNGGPGYTTYVPGYYMFKQAFTFGNMGYASAIGTILFVVIFLLTVLTMRFLKSKD